MIKLYSNTDQFLDVWSDTHYAEAESIDTNTIITQKMVKVNPNPGVYNAWAFKHAKSRLTNSWTIHPNLVIEDEEDPFNQISVWYASNPIVVGAQSTKTGEEMTKPVNTFWMMRSCLKWHMGGVWLEEIPNPALAETAYFNPQLDEMGEMKKTLKKQERWHHTLDPKIGGQMSTSTKKVKASSENFAKAREAARIQRAEGADKKARQLLVILDAGGSYEDIASIYDCSIEAARMAVSRARRRLGVEIPAEVAPEPVQAPTAAPEPITETAMPEVAQKRKYGDDPEFDKAAEAELLAGIDL